MNYSKVTLPIIAISTESVKFDMGGTGGRREVLLHRKYRKLIVWKLMKDGLYVHEEFCRQYGLTNI